MSSCQPPQNSIGKKKVSRTLERALKPISDKAAGKEATTAFIRKPIPYSLPDISKFSLFSQVQAQHGVDAPSEQSKTLPPSPPIPHLSQLYRLPAFTLSQFSFDQYKYRDIAKVPKLQPSKRHSVQDSIVSPWIQEDLQAAEIYPSYQSNLFFPSVGRQSFPTQKAKSTPVPSIRRNNITDFTIVESRVLTVRCFLDPPKPETSKRSLRKVNGKNDLRLSNSNSQSRSSSGRLIAEQPRRAKEVPASICSNSSSLSDLSITGQPRRTKETLASPHSNASSLSIHVLNHFKTFCVLDTMLPGNPIALMSSNLGSTERDQDDDRLFLTIQQGEKDSLDFVADQDDQGEIIHYLVLFGTFLSVSGQDGYILASLIDVSHLVDAILDDNTSPEDEEDVWLSLASETAPNKVSHASTISLLDAIQEIENMRLDATSHLSQTPFRSRSSLSPANAALRDFMEDTQNLYKDCFCLALSLVDSSYYEISLVSPSLRESGEDYLEGHLKYTGRATINELAERLAEGRNFSIGVRWGLTGVEKQMYCTPVFGPDLESWVCVLVDGGLPNLWDCEMR